MKRLNWIVVIVALVMLTGCQQSPTLGIQVKDVPADAPEFKREYTAYLANGVSVKVTARTFLGRRFSWELTQSDGRWVLFDPDAVADRILDPLLVPIVERHVAEMKRLDKEYIESQPKTFTDEDGIVWERREVK